MQSTKGRSTKSTGEGKRSSILIGYSAADSLAGLRLKFGGFWNGGLDTSGRTRSAAPADGQAQEIVHGPAHLSDRDLRTHATCARGDTCVQLFQGADSEGAWHTRRWNGHETLHHHRQKQHLLQRRVFVPDFAQAVLFGNGPNQRPVLQ